MKDYGQLTPMVVTAIALMSAVGAIILLVRRRANWEPLQENLGKGAKNIGAVMTAVAIGLIWASCRNDKNLLTTIAIFAGICTLVSLIVYNIIAGVYSYKKIHIVKGRSVETKVIGGFKITEAVKSSMKLAEERAGRVITIQEYFEGVQYEAEHVWSRGSLEISKAIFILCYVGLIMFGAIALSSTALRMALES